MVNFIADIGSNWASKNKDRNRWRKLIDVAKEIGCSGVKFQIFKGNKLYAKGKKESIEEFNNKIEELKKRELPVEIIPTISAYTKKIKIELGVTPFYIECIREIHKYLNFIKISSFDIMREKLIIEAAKTKLPIIISGGLANKNELWYIISKIVDEGNNRNITLLHCVSNYPTFPKDCNLAVIKKYINIFNIPIGWSDHTGEPGVIYEAIGNGASIVEFHLDLEDMEGEEFKYGHCWIPDNIAEVINNVRIGELARGNSEYKILDEIRLNKSDLDGLRPMYKKRG